MESQRASVQVVVTSGRNLQAFFHRHEKTNKYDCALLITSWFPEVAWKLPPRPKFYDPEPWIMASFDAIILGAAHLNLTTRTHRDAQSNASSDPFAGPSVA
jgi:hypothetical protein